MHDESNLLSAARRGDPVARDHLVKRYLKVVRSLAGRYRDLGLPYDDLVQEGSLGLLDAIDHYDDRRGAPFDAYARFRIRRAIRNALTEKSRLIRLPKQIVERRRAIDMTEVRLTAARGHPPTAAEIAAVTGLTPDAVTELREIATGPISLDQPVLPDGSTLESVLADRSASDPAAETIDHDQTVLVDRAVEHLPPRQREIVSRHFGIGCAPEEMATVAANLHLSQQRARTIERDALYRLRDELERGPVRTSPRRESAAARIRDSRPARINERDKGGERWRRS
jgi:RNA polymerase primary sigma factor